MVLRENVAIGPKPSWGAGDGAGVEAQWGCGRNLGKSTEVLVMGFNSVLKRAQL